MVLCEIPVVVVLMYFFADPSTQLSPNLPLPRFHHYLSGSRCDSGLVDENIAKLLKVVGTMQFLCSLNCDTVKENGA